ncbi:conserved Plasmodium protein, unknown function [Plasmodium vinckei lentum]|uniref:Regulator of chromosome condensation n=1 Tax=Plasmodium vinckei lentum TaxID=138297 RepID=A0A6V7S5A8_PLAVN|nr:conserved Plasmodium protein, unknown function [Plasmodium vinckei lentum]
MRVSNLKGEKLSNVYLYKNGEIKLIKELENVFIKNISTCSNSINILLKNEEDINKGNKNESQNILIQINKEINDKCTNLKNGQSYINISYSTIFINNYVDSDLVLYSIHGQDPNKIKYEFEKEKAKEVNTKISINDLRKGLIKSEKNNVWTYPIDNLANTKNVNENENEDINGKSSQTKNGNDNMHTKYVPTNCEKVYFCYSGFYAIDDKNNVCRWDIDISNNTNIIKYNYLSKFLSYIKFTEKIIDISCGHSHVLFLSENKNCYAYGNNNSYQISNEKNPNFDTPKLIKINKIKYIAAGHSHNLICTYKNEIYGWGNNIHKQICSGENFIKSPKLILNQSIWNSINKQTKRARKKMKENSKFNEKIYEHNLFGQDVIIPKKYSTQYKQINNMHYKLKKVKSENKFKVKKLCCGFSFSCILMKNKNCYVLGITDFANNQNKEEMKIHTFKKINKKKIDNIFCNFFDIILVDHLKISKIFPPIINPKLNNKIYLLFNFKIKRRHSLQIKLANQCLYNCKKSCNEIDKECDDSDEKMGVDFCFNYDSDHCEYCEIEQSSEYEQVGEKIKLSLQKSSKYVCTQASQYYSFPKVDTKNRNEKLLINLICSNIILNYNKTVYVSEYEGRIKNIFPNNFALMKNLKIKIKINKVPIHLNSDYIYVLYEYVNENNQNKIYKIIKGVMNKKRTYIYSKLPLLLQTDVTCKKDNLQLSINKNSDTYESDAYSEGCSYENGNPNYRQAFTKCNVYYSFGFHFYKRPFSMLFIKPEIVNISPNNINLHENNVIHIDMAYFSKSFKFIYVILYNPNFNFILTKAYYDLHTNKYSFTTPLISATAFKQVQHDFINFHVFASYNNVEYSENEIKLTITNL